tara:strand:+ start:1393 stop:2916 length:1524 start_codon:yes stop_codon:yes gene_type:complete
MSTTSKRYSLAEILEDPVLFIARLWIKDKEGNLVQFGEVMTPEQITIIKALHKYNRVAIVKARQMGITTVVRAFCFWEAYTSHRTINSVVVSNKQGSANEILRIDKRFYQGLPDPLKRESSINRHRITFDSTDTSIIAMSAQSDASDRGYTLNSVHATEFAFYDNPEDWLASTLASVNAGKLILESTANHFGDALHKIAIAKDDGWHTIFLPWSSFPQYRAPLHSSKYKFVATDDEEAIMKKHGLDLKQISWRRRKIKEIKDVRLFKREYPLCIEEAYAMAADNYFHDDHFEVVQKIKIADNTVEVISPHSTKDNYVMGVDIAGGGGGDYSVGTVLSRLTSAPVAIVSSNQMSVNDFAIACMNLAKRYNAMIAFEENNHGHAFKEVLHFNNWTNYRAFKTTAKSKITIYELLKTYLEEGMITYLDEPTYNEMRMLVRSLKGLAPSAPDGYYDDRCMAYAIGLYHLKDVRMPLPDYDRWMTDAIKPNKTPDRTANPLHVGRRLNIGRR